MISEVDIFHLTCPGLNSVTRVARFIIQPTMDDVMMSQLTLKCELCTTKIHLDVWPMINTSENLTPFNGTDGLARK
jgi:aspartate carbamoyltransferase regulatory subunit